MSKYTDILQQYWGYSSFRPLQEEIITSVCEGNDTLGLMPTGGGKSIIFQVAAMSMEGICIVVTPLIALMKDQVENLKKRYIKAAAVYSGMTTEEIRVTLDNCLFGHYKFLYVSPERLSTELFLSRLTEMEVCLLTVDESHCISQWGYDFRPSYMHIADIREKLPGVPLLALTATATFDVIKDIQEKLQFPKENVFSASFYRKNLAYVVKYTENKEVALIYYLKQEKGSSLVYVRNRKETQEMAKLLCSKGITASFYHAGLPDAEKDQRQRAWQANKIQVIVCTNAFGMGIDKPDVRLVLHLDFPDSLEEYYQEAGRAGRDRLSANAILLCSKNDKIQLKRRVSTQFPSREFIRNVYDALGNFLQVAEGDGNGFVYDFNIVSFCTFFRYPVLQTYHALKLLEMSGYIELTDEQDNRSRILFTVKREDLYQMNWMNKTMDELIHILLRTYTGLFSEYTYIREEIVAQKMNVNVQQLYEMLIELSRAHIISYIPRKKTPYIIYTQRRLDTKYVLIPRIVYEERKSRYEDRISAMIHYAYTTDACRSSMLLAYFGEKEAEVCGVCDVCLSEKRENSDALFETLKLEVFEKLSKQPLYVHQLAEELSVEPKKSLPYIRRMVDLSLLVMEDGKLTLPHH